MRVSLLTVSFLAALLAGAAAPTFAQPQQQPPQPPQTQPEDTQQFQLAPPKPYKQVPVTLPQPIKDPSFEAFRKELAGIAQRKDRAALGRLTAQSFFWIFDDKDNADKSKPGIDNLSQALGLDAPDGSGWELLGAYASDPTGQPDPQHPGVICAPADPTFDENAAAEVARATDTDVSEWGYPTADGIEVHAGPQPSSPVIEKLGLYLVRVYPDDSPAAAVQGDVLRVVTPSGKVGYISADQLLPLNNDQLCYAKDGQNWKIAGFLGGGAGSGP